MEPDPYCDLILSKKLPVEIVLDEPEVLAFIHPSPSFRPAHLIAIPKRHIRSLTELPEHPLVAVAMIDALARLAAQVEAEHGQARIFTNVGALQHSRHLHWHVVAEQERIAKSPPTAEAAIVWAAYWQEIQP